MWEQFFVCKLEYRFILLLDLFCDLMLNLVKFLENLVTTYLRKLLPVLLRYLPRTQTRARVHWTTWHLLRVLVGCSCRHILLKFSFWLITYVKLLIKTLNPLVTHSQGSHNWRSIQKWTIANFIGVGLWTNWVCNSLQIFRLSMALLKWHPDNWWRLNCFMICLRKWA